MSGADDLRKAIARAGVSEGLEAWELGPYLQAIADEYERLQSQSKGAPPIVKRFVELLTRAIPALSVSVDLAKSDKSQADRRKLLREVEAVVGAAKVNALASSNHDVHFLASGDQELSLRERLNMAARAIAKGDGFDVEEGYDLASVKVGRGRHYFNQACAAYEAFYGDGPDPAEIFPEGEP